MDSWMDGLMVGLIGWLMDGWMYVCEVYEIIHIGCMYVWKNGWIDG